MEGEGDRGRKMGIYSTYIHARIHEHVHQIQVPRRVEQETGQLTDGLKIFLKDGREERVKARLECWF